ncbi:MAG TPA: hypothetical protein VHC69_27300 [Polyangiaceae bacterium]|nr:hypothetical protein [Polyangiaceae bacterium]
MASSVVGQFGGRADSVESTGAKLFIQEAHPEKFATRALRSLERHFASSAW